MNIGEKDGHVLITADEGYFLICKTNSDLYGEAISLGYGDTPDNYDERPIEEWPDEQISDEEALNIIMGE